MKAPGHVEGGLEAGARRPEHGEAPIVRERIPAADREDVLRRERYARHAQVLAAPVQHRGEPVADPQPVEPGEAFADEHLLDVTRLHEPSGPEMERVQAGLRAFRNRHHAADRGWPAAARVERDVEHEPRLHLRDARDLAEPRFQDRSARARAVAKTCAKRERLVVGALRGAQRLVRRQRRHERRDSARHDERDRDHLTLHAREVAQELSVEHPHQRRSAGRAGLRVALLGDDAAVRKMEHALGHGGDRRVVRDDGRRRAELLVHARDRLEHELTGLVVERAGRLIAEEHVGPLGHGSGDRHALLLPARELRREVVEARARARRCAARPRGSSAAPRSRSRAPRSRAP